MATLCHWNLGFETFIHDSCLIFRVVRLENQYQDLPMGHTSSYSASSRTTFYHQLSMLLRSLMVASRLTPTYRHYVCNQSPETFIITYNVFWINFMIQLLIYFVFSGCRRWIGPFAIGRGAKIQKTWKATNPFWSSIRRIALQNENGNSTSTVCRRNCSWSTYGLVMVDGSTIQNCCIRKW